MPFGTRASRLRDGLVALSRRSPTSCGILPYQENVLSWVGTTLFNCRRTLALLAYHEAMITVC